LSRPVTARRSGEVEQPVADLLDRGAQAARAPGRRQRVGHVVAGQPADRDRDAATSTISVDRRPFASTIAARTR
jgi:hypothetical protein